MSPSMGRLVIYTLSEQDASEINRRRTSGYSIHSRLEKDPPEWHIGAQAHIGNEARMGDQYPAIVIRAWSKTCCNLQVLLDGNDTYWGLSRNQSVSGGAEQGRWHWPERVE